MWLNWPKRTINLKRQLKISSRCHLFLLNLVSEAKSKFCISKEIAFNLFSVRPPLIYQRCFDWVLFTTCLSVTMTANGTLKFKNSIPKQVLCYLNLWILMSMHGQLPRRIQVKQNKLVYFHFNSTEHRSTSTLKEFCVVKASTRPEISDRRGKRNRDVQSRSLPCYSFVFDKCFTSEKSI